MDYDPKKVKRLSVTIPEEFVAGLEDVAEDLKITVSEAVREAVATYLLDHVWKDTIGEVAMEALRKRKTNEEVLAAVKRKFPDSATSLGSISWYRSKLRAEGEDVPTDRQAREAKG